MKSESRKIISLYFKDSSEKDRVSSICKALGISLSSAINIFVVHFHTVGGFDFSVRVADSDKLADAENLPAVKTSLSIQCGEDWERFTQTCDSLGITKMQALGYFFTAFNACGGFPFPVMIPGTECAGYNVTFHLDGPAIVSPDSPGISG